MAIRRATLEDIDELHLIEQDSFASPWSKESLKNDIEDEDRTYYLIIEEEDKIVGYAGAWMVYDEGQITNVAIKKEYRRGGFGGRLVRRMIKDLFQRNMAEIFLEVRVSNYPALALYRRLGFSVKGMRKNYYVDPAEDAYIMSLVKEVKEN